MKSVKTFFGSAAMLAAVLMLVAGCGRKNDLQLTNKAPNSEVRTEEAAAKKAAESGDEDARKRKNTPKDTPFFLDPLIK